MVTNRTHCAWCGCKVQPEQESHRQHPWFCPECHETFEAEAHRSFHPAEERQPHND